MTLQLITKQQLIDNVWVFRFKPSEPLTWTAGQFIYVELPHDNPDAEGTKRWFTVSSAPYEGIIQITTRVTNSTFKQALGKLPIGGELPLIDPPDGDFIWQASALPHVFIAGGIGVTPFYSILKQRFYDHLPLDVHLLYASRDGNVPFKDELAEWLAADSNLHITYLTSQQMTAEGLLQAEPKLGESLVYLSGPEPMVESIGDALVAQGLPKNNLKQDFFPNYTKENY